MILNTARHRDTARSIKYFKGYQVAGCIIVQNDAGLVFITFGHGGIREDNCQCLHAILPQFCASCVAAGCALPMKFSTSRQVVDWYHAKLHLTQAATALHGEGTAAARRWLRDQETPLLQGHAERLAHKLLKLSQKHPHGAEALRREAGYFQENYRRMQYLELREEGFPIGSGMVESACKQFGARLAGSGMRWSRSDLERLLPIRAAIMSHRFDDLWQKTYHLPLN